MTAWQSLGIQYCQCSYHILIDWRHDVCSSKAVSVEPTNVYTHWYMRERGIMHSFPGLLFIIGRPHLLIALA